MNYVIIKLGVETEDEARVLEHRVANVLLRDDVSPWVPCAVLRDVDEIDVAREA